MLLGADAAVAFADLVIRNARHRQRSVAAAPNPTPSGMAVGGENHTSSTGRSRPPVERDDPQRSRQDAAPVPRRRHGRTRGSTRRWPRDGADCDRHRPARLGAVPQVLHRRLRGGLRRHRCLARRRRHHESATTCIPGPIGAGTTASYHLIWQPATDKVSPSSAIVYDVSRASTSGGPRRCRRAALHGWTAFRARPAGPARA
jgi:hypothetical protein